MENYLAYVRVSSQEQASRNLSIPSQIEQIKQYAQKNDILIKKVFEEKHSAYKGARPIFHDLLKQLKSDCSLAGLIVFKFDRISRNPDDFLKIDKIVRAKGLDIVSVTEPMLNSYLGRYLVRDMQNRAILYSEELSFRIKLGMRKKLQSGGYIGGPPPYGFKVVGGGYLVPDDDKSKIVKAIFEMYSTGRYGYKQLADMIRHDFKLPSFYKKQAEKILKNTIYYGVRTKTRKLSKEEYIFRGYDTPGLYTESYQLDYIQPIITEELFTRCQSIKEGRNKLRKSPTGKARFAPLFKCICGRNMVRDDKKNQRYLRCRNHVNDTFPVKCNQKYTNLNNIYGDVEQIIRDVIGTKDLRQGIKEYVESEMSLKVAERTLRLRKKTTSLAQIESKLESYTDDYVADRLGSREYKQLTAILYKKQSELQQEISSLDDYQGYVEGGRKLLHFMDILDKWQQDLDNKDNQGKSSNMYSMLFTLCSNCVIEDRKVQSYALSEPFNMLQNADFSKWGRGGESNPCLNVITRDVYYHSWLIGTSISIVNGACSSATNDDALGDHDSVFRGTHCRNLGCDP